LTKEVLAIPIFRNIDTYKTTNTDRFILRFRYFLIPFFHERERERERERMNALYIN